MKTATASSPTSAARAESVCAGTAARSVPTAIKNAPKKRNSLAPAKRGRGNFMSLYTIYLRPLARAQIESRCNLKLLLRLVLASRPHQRLAPFEMQPAPVRRVFAGFLELGNREVGAALQDQRHTPALQRIGEVRAFRVGALELGDGAVEIALRKKHPAPFSIRKRDVRRTRGDRREPARGAVPIVLQRGDVAADAHAE